MGAILEQKLDAGEIRRIKQRDIAFAKSNDLVFSSFDQGRENKCPPSSVEVLRSWIEQDREARQRHERSAE